MDSLFVLDASGYLYRSYFAISSMTNDKGESTNALFGFIRSVQKLIKDFTPQHFVAVFDGPNNAMKRLQIYPAYKAHRDKMPPDLRYQIEWAKTYCDLMGYSKLDIPETEADDAMASVAAWASSNKRDVYLCTSDKDMAQMVNDHIFLLNTHKDNLLMGRKMVEEKFGVLPEQIVDLLAICGDASDNVPGLSGFGPKTAISLLKEFGNLDEILDHPEKIPGKKKQETIIKEAELVRISRRLVTLDTAVSVPQREDFYRIKPPELDEVKALFLRMSFYSLLKELDEIYGGDTEEIAYHLIDTEDELHALIDHLSQQREISFDTETTDTHPMRANLVGIGFAVKPGQAWYVPVNGQLGYRVVLEAITPLFENPNISFYGHNVKYDLHILLNNGIKTPRIGFDTILASYLLHSHSRRHALDTLALEKFGKVKTAIKDLIGTGKKAITMQEVPIKELAAYCCEDVDYTLRLKLDFEKELKERGLEKLFYEIELPLLPVLLRMERAGIYLDEQELVLLSKEVKQELSRLEKEIYDQAGEEFNINSTKQLSEILFIKLGIPPPKKTATGFSTNAEVLELLTKSYPIAVSLLEYRQLEKLRSTYIDTLPQEVLPATGRIHCTFNQTVAATGRLSCQDPNLQNIPVRKDVGRRIRKAFRPKLDNWSYISADYSQIELRLLAHLCDDENLIKAFREGRDIHTDTASKVFNIPIEEVQKEDRYLAKAVNFGIIYGQQAFGLAQEIGTSVKKAQDFIDRYFTRYAKVKEYLQQSKDLAAKTGKAVTATGRERLLPEIHSQNRNLRNQAERLAVNTPIQGMAADLIKIAMLTIENALKGLGARGFMILQIHDELIFEVPDEEITSLCPLIQEKMQSVMQLKVPLVVDLAVGKNWMEC